MNKKTGQAGSLVAPISPIAAHEADVADPGEVSEAKAQQRAARTGKYGALPFTPFRPPAATSTSTTTSTTSAEESPPEETEKSWMEIELVGEDDQPVAGERYRVTLPDKSVDEGTLDQNGFARLAGFEAGTCMVTFPDLDEDAWSFIESVGPKSPA